jgi:hypothetical protein
MGVYKGIAQDNVTITSGVANLTTLTVSGVTTFSGALASTAPVTKTADFTVADTETFLINNKSGSACSVTLPAAASWSGRILVIKTIQAQAVNSAGSNVVPIDSATAGTAIVTGTAGKWAILVSNGTNWVVMATG